MLQIKHCSIYGKFKMALTTIIQHFLSKFLCKRQQYIVLLLCLNWIDDRVTKLYTENFLWGNSYVPFNQWYKDKCMNRRPHIYTHTLVWHTHAHTHTLTHKYPAVLYKLSTYEHWHAFGGEIFSIVTNIVSSCSVEFHTTLGWWAIRKPT